ncbi:MAG: SpoIIE family protein phosphatase [Spirochaetales bacterium]|nr:SpoIIE family protein phosphatase [Spirochaetales bacterium]
MEQESYKTLRHQLRTSLNHIVGYSEILQQDAKDLGHENFIPDLKKVSDEAEKLKTIIYSYFRHDETKYSGKEIEDIKQLLYLPIYEIIGIVQVIKQSFAEGEGGYFVGDIGRIMKAANEMLDFIDKQFQRLFLDQLVTEEQIPLNKRFIPEDSAASEIQAGTAGGALLVVDDEEMNRELMTRHLSRQGYDVSAVASGPEALKLLGERFFDLIILDIMMPEMNGFTVLEIIKNTPAIKHIPVIIMSALDDMNSISHCIEVGAEDYLPKNFDPVLLKARVGACIEKKRLRDKEMQYLNALVDSQKMLEKELADAADYVTSLLPRKISGLFSTDWIYLPSTQLGGDCFDYQWLDDDHFAMYLLDVSGHGIGAALLSVSVMNVLRTRSLGNIDFTKPDEVLGALNSTFRMENQNDMYFSIWYGVFSKEDRSIIFSSAGSPPALMVSLDDKKQTKMELLKCPGVIIGIQNDVQFELKKIVLPKNCKIYLFSDGIFEVHKRDGSMLHLNEFTSIIQQQALTDMHDLNKIITKVQGLTGTASFRDDVSLVEFCFACGEI